MRFSLKLWFKVVAIIAITLTLWFHADIDCISMAGGRRYFNLRVYDKEIFNAQYLNTRFYTIFRISILDAQLINYQKANKGTLYPRFIK